MNRWQGFGPYYAMFPVAFAYNVLDTYCPAEGAVLDPFCGRGTVPFLGQATGRRAAGVDVNPVGWVYAKVKTDPEPNPKKLLKLLRDLLASVTQEDCLPENEFQKWAWESEVIGFLRVARRRLKWKTRRTDRTLMAFIIYYLHGKIGEGVSNQMRQPKAMGPDYSINWWKERDMLPPKVDLYAFYSKRINWRYKHGIIDGQRAKVFLGKSEELLNKRRFGNGYDLLLTSPPYCDVCDYAYDNWIRLWLLGGDPLPDYKRNERYTNKAAYEKMLLAVFKKAKRLLKDDAVIFVRTDAREFTLNTTLKVLTELWSDYHFTTKADMPNKTQTSLYGDKSIKPGETDILGIRQ